MKSPIKLKNKLCYSVRVFREIQAGKGPTGEQFFLLGPGVISGYGNQGWIKQSVGNSEFLSPLLAIYAQTTNFTPLARERFLETWSWV